MNGVEVLLPLAQDEAQIGPIPASPPYGRVRSGGLRQFRRRACRPD